MDLVYQRQVQRDLASLSFHELLGLVLLDMQLLVAKFRDYQLVSPRDTFAQGRQQTTHQLALVSRASKPKTYSNKCLLVIQTSQNINIIITSAIIWPSMTVWKSWCEHEWWAIKCKIRFFLFLKKYFKPFWKNILKIIRKCENCSNTRDIIRQKYFFNLPKIMVFALDRFDDNHEFFVDKSVRFPMT